MSGKDARGKVLEYGHALLTLPLEGLRADLALLVAQCWRETS